MPIQRVQHHRVDPARRRAVRRRQLYHRRKRCRSPRRWTSSASSTSSSPRRRPRRRACEDCKTIAGLGLKAKVLTHIRCTLDDAKLAVGHRRGRHRRASSAPRRCCASSATARTSPPSSAWRARWSSYIRDHGLEVRFSTEDSFRSELDDILAHLRGGGPPGREPRRHRRHGGRGHAHAGVRPGQRAAQARLLRHRVPRPQRLGLRHRQRLLRAGGRRHARRYQHPGHRRAQRHRPAGRPGRAPVCLRPRHW